MASMYIHRLLEKTLSEALATFPATLITGPRQSGKTTLVRETLGARYRYVSLDELDIRSFAVDDPRGFLERNPPPLVIDEIQNAPQLLSFIKARIDEHRQSGQWVLTGSQHFPLMKNVSESLAGRIAVLTLYPFGLEEMTGQLRLELGDAASFLRHLAQPPAQPTPSLSVGSWLLRGGYPEVFVNPQVSTKLWFSSYLQTYIDRDVRGNIRTANLSDFERFLRLLAARTGQELRYSELARDLGVTVPTIKSWVSSLESCGLVFILPPYHRNFGKRIIKSPKCYFMDTGLVSYLVGLQSEDHLLQGPMAGALFETACVAQFVKRFTALADPCSLYFWRSTDGQEVDLLVETADGPFPIEMKLTSTISRRHTLSLQAWLELSARKNPQGLIVSGSLHEGPLGGGISNCHFTRL